MAVETGGTHGPRTGPARPTPPISEFRRITRGMTRGMKKGHKRSRSEVDTSSTGSDEPEDLVFSPRNNTATTSIDDLAELITALHQTIHQQSQTIENIRADLLEVRDQNTQLQEEVSSIRSQFKAFSVSVPSTRTWASVAAGLSSTPSDGESNASQTTNKEKSDENTNCVRITTKLRPTEDGETSPAFVRYLSTESANAQIRNALHNGEATKDAQVAGVGTTKTGYVIRFKDKESAELARTNNEWLRELGNDTKLVKPRFGVVVHRTPTEELSVEEKMEESINKIMNENDLTAQGHQIVDMAWLKNKEKPLGRHASLGLWFDSATAAEWAVNNGLVFGQTYVGSIERYQIKRKRCHRCQRYGHLAWACREAVRCGHCMGEHDRRRCPPNSTAKCADCKGPHPTGHKECKGQGAQSNWQ